MPDPQTDAATFSSTGGQGVQTGARPGSFTGFIQNLVNIGQARKNAAAGNLDRMLLAADKGFPVDPKAVVKASKQAGIPLADHTDMTGMLPQGQGTPKPGQTSNPEANATRDAQQGEDPHAQAFNVKSITDVKARQEKQTELAVDGVIRQSVLNAHLKGANEQQTLENTQKMLELKSAAMKGDSHALGQLYRLGEIKNVDIPADVYNSMNDKQKSDYVNLQLGWEEPKAKIARESAAAQQQVTDGRFANLEDATKYIQAIDSGGAVPPEISAKMVSHPLSEMVKAAESMDVFAHMGYSGDQLISIGQRFSTMGLAALPAPLQNLYMEQAKNQKMEVQAARTSAGAAASRARTDRESVEGFNRIGANGKPEHVQGSLEDTMSEQAIQRSEQEIQMKKVEAVLKSKDDKDFLTGYVQTMLQHKSNPNLVPQSVVDDYNNELVRKSGGVVTAEQVKHWFKSDTTQYDYSWPDKNDSPTDATPGQP